jgi:hypothetical protein
MAASMTRLYMRTLLLARQCTKVKHVRAAAGGAGADDVKTTACGVEPGASDAGGAFGGDGVSGAAS